VSLKKKKKRREKEKEREREREREKGMLFVELVAPRSGLEK